MAHSVKPRGYGGYVCCSEQMRSYLINLAPLSIRSACPGGRRSCAGRMSDPNMGSTSDVLVGFVLRYTQMD